MQLLCERLVVVGQREERVAVRTGRCHVHVGEREPLPEAPYQQQAQYRAVACRGHPRLCVNEAAVQADAGSL